MVAGSQKDKIATEKVQKVIGGPGDPQAIGIPSRIHGN
jgi:hypothetical protein